MTIIFPFTTYISYSDECRMIKIFQYALSMFRYFMKFQNSTAQQNEFNSFLNNQP